MYPRGYIVGSDEMMTQKRTKNVQMRANIHNAMLTSFGVFLNLRPDESEGPLPGSGDGIA